MMTVKEVLDDIQTLDGGDTLLCQLMALHKHSSGNEDKVNMLNDLGLSLSNLQELRSAMARIKKSIAVKLYNTEVNI